MEKFSDNLMKIIDLYPDLDVRDIYDLKRIIDEDIEQIEKNKTFDLIRNSILITENQNVDKDVSDQFINNIIQSAVNKYGLNEVFSFVSKTRDEIDVYRILDKLYQLPQVANEHELPKSELATRIQIREKYKELREKYENEHGKAFPSGTYLKFTSNKHNIL